MAGIPDRSTVRRLSLRITSKNGDKSLKYNRISCLFGIAAWTLPVALAAGCSPTVDIRGNLPDKEVVDTIRVGQSNKQIVQELLGTPSTTALFDQEIWLYIGEKTETTAFFSPTVVERRVLAVRFDSSSKVASISHYGLKDAKDVDPVSRETPTKGKELTFVEQIIGNIGRFNTSEENK